MERLEKTNIAIEQEKAKQSEQRESEKKMIYRKWSLLTGPTSIVAGIVATVAVVNFVVFDNDPFGMNREKKSSNGSSNSASK